MWQATFDRTSLDLEPLVIDGDHTTGAFHLAEEDCTWPAFTVRRTYAPSSEVVGGEQLLAKVLNQGSIGLKITAHGTNAAEMATAMLELEAATSQFTYTFTLHVADVLIGTYEAHAEMPQWGALDSGNIKAALNEATITIPLNPPAGA